MIYFITDKKHDITISEENEEIIVTNDISLIDSFLDKIIASSVVLSDSDLLEIGLDLETTGLDPYTSDILLIILGNKETKFVIDYQWIKEVAERLQKLEGILNMINQYGFTILGHNIKFDWKFIKIHLKIELEKCYDTMIAEQRLYAGYEIRHSLDVIIERYFNIPSKEMNKALRMEFVNVNPLTFIFKTKHILYGAKDIEYLFDIKEKQLEFIIRWNMEFLIFQIEMPLINVLAECELEGFILNQEKWKTIINENEDIKFAKEKELDDIIRNLRKDLPLEQRLQLIGGKFDRLRTRHPKQINEGLFGEPIAERDLMGSASKVKTNTGNFNYGSASQIIDLFARLKQPLPNEFGAYVIPILDLSTNKIKQKGFTTGEKAIESYLIDNPDSIMKPFIKTLIDFREATTELNTFGQSFLDYINPITKKIHTIFRQCQAVNGRLQSGDTKENLINIQNIPAKKKFRESFGTDEGYHIVTIDLSGAEVVVMADKANDTKLFELAMKGDIHSHMAQSGWRNIYRARGESELAETFTVSKTVNNESHRKPCKNLTFAGVYGCHAKKAGKTINVSKEEGQIYLNTLKAEIPLTYKMVETNVALAMKQGYLVLNKRTNSRIWFPKVIEGIRNQRKGIYKYDKFGNQVLLDFMDAHEVDGQSRNVPISGTQADMLKEAMVEIRREFKNLGIDAVLLAQVHDELVYKIPSEWLECSLARNISYFDSNGEEKMCNVPDFIKIKLLEVCNKYLTNIKIDAEMHVGKTWTK